MFRQEVRPTPDPIAKEVARTLHRKYQPPATILFGSRSRGDHRPDSDIDLMLVTAAGQNQPEEDIDRATAAMAEAAYEQPVKAYVTLVSLPEFREQQQYRNSLCTYALLDGVVSADNPEEYRSKYAGPNPPPDLYDWTGYQYELKRANEYVKIMIMVLQGKGLALDRELRGLSNNPFLDGNKTIRDWPVARIQDSARGAINHGLYALLETVGQNGMIINVKHKEPFQYILDLLQDHQELEIPATGIPIPVYAAANGLDRMNPTEFLENTERDLQAIKKAANKRRRAKTAALKQR